MQSALSVIASWTGKRSAKLLSRKKSSLRLARHLICGSPPEYHTLKIVI
jgi:hypothetical protein